MNITIPASIEEATTGLDGIGKLLTAKEWERAAIVYAYTEPSEGNRASAAARAAATKMSFTAFAKLGIAGLRSKEDVSNYHRAWASAIQDGAAEAKPGATVELPSLPWKSPLADTDRGRDAIEERAMKRIFSDPERFARVVESPEVADLVAERVANTPATRWRADTIIRETRPEPTHHPDAKPAGAAIQRVIEAIEDFWDHPIHHNGREMTYREVIEIVRDNPDALLQASFAPTASLHVGLGRALDGMATEARRLAEPLMLKAGTDG